jgi:hypothetical protein
MPTSLSTLFYLLAFVVPGFVLDTAFHAGQRQPEREKDRSAVRYLSLAVLNYAMWSPLVFLLLQPTFLSSHAHRLKLLAGLWCLVILLGPIVLGLIGARLSRGGAIRSMLTRLGLKPVHQIPSAWDYVFHDIPRETWIYVTLKDGSAVAGLFGRRSFASSDPGERDLFIEGVYRATTGKPWAPVAGGAGLLIAGDEIRHIELWDNVQGANHE